MTSLPVEPLITTADDPRTTQCGGKARSLWDITPIVAVPKFVTIPPSWFGQAAHDHLARIATYWDQWASPHQQSTQSLRELATLRLTDVLRDALGTQLQAALPGVTRFSVRSSATGEDGDRRSFAGLYDSVLDVGYGALEQAVLTVWRSWFSVRAITHRATTSWQEPAISVVVQRMVHAQQAGVAIVYGTTIEIEAVHGTGERLVNGTAEPHRYLFSSPVDHPTSPSPVDQAAAIDQAVAARRAAALASTLHDRQPAQDLDVEWAADDTRVWIVQARPLATRPPTTQALDWVNSCTQPTLRSVELYAEAVPGELVPLGALAEVVGHYRTKRRLLYTLCADHDCDLGAALVVHFNELGLLDDTPWSDLVGRLGPTAVLDISPIERQVILATSGLRRYLIDLCADGPQTLHTMVIREFVSGDCGVLSTVSGQHIRVEFSPDGLLGLNRGVAHTDTFLIPGASPNPALPPGWPASTVAVLRAVTRQFAERHGDAVIEWVLRGERLVLVDYSLLHPGATTMPTTEGTVISGGACAGPALVLSEEWTQTLIDDSVAPVVSVGMPLPDPGDTRVASVHNQIGSLAHPPVVVVDRPYAVLATLIPHVAGFVFTRSAPRLCHLAILLREHGTPAICRPGHKLPDDGQWLRWSSAGVLDTDLTHGGDA
ncbi:MAG TPA: PEP/pyruvate-binding domain-containing protein [Pseudonocardiaceae bacterium]|nr:PEP/pyruvate-binding domain-containing protein [Pseudonocardiaceae bacterium]